MAVEDIDKTLGSAIIADSRGVHGFVVPAISCQCQARVPGLGIGAATTLPICFAIPSRTLAVVVRTSQRAPRAPSNAHAPEL